MHQGATRIYNLQNIVGNSFINGLLRPITRHKLQQAAEIRLGRRGSLVRIQSPRPFSSGPFWSDRWQFIPSGEVTLSIRTGSQSALADTFHRRRSPGGRAPARREVPDVLITLIAAGTRARSDLPSPDSPAASTRRISRTAAGLSRAKQRLHEKPFVKFRQARCEQTLFWRCHKAS